jgi:hypothetical protein
MLHQPIPSDYLPIFKNDMKKTLQIGLASMMLVLLAITGCNKFLDIQPKGKQLLKTVNDYDLWLNSPNLTYISDISSLNFFTDYTDRPTIVPTSIASSDLIFKWAPQFGDATTVPPMWSTFYNSISYFNTVINNVDGAEGGTDQQKRSLKAEALLGRAYIYLYLVNLYGKEFDPATAAQDLAVPFVTASDVTAATPARSTVKDIYDHIISDINTALPDLPASNSSNRFRGSVLAANSVLARTYFYMRDYVNAQKYAQLSLNSTVSMFDYNTAGATSPTANPVFPRLASRQDGIYARGPISISSSTTSGGSFVSPTLSFLQSFNVNDRRLNLFKNATGNGALTNPIRGSFYYHLAISGNNFQQNMGTTVEEMKLIIAEGAARAGDLPTALQQINDIRINRFAPANYQPIQSNDPAIVLQKVFEERSFELPFTGLRWFDMRRLDAEGRMPAIVRTDAAGNVIATLPPHGVRYTLQIPLNILVFNPDMPQNP